MLRFRGSDGKAYRAPEGILSVEVCDASGRPAAVFVIRGDREVVRYAPGDDGFLRYCAAYGLTPAVCVSMEDSDLWDGKGGGRVIAKVK